MTTADYRRQFRVRLVAIAAGVVAVMLAVGLPMIGGAQGGDIKGDYDRANSLNQRVNNKVYDVANAPVWIQGSQKFWYSKPVKGGTQFVGEDRINHTPKDETLNLKIGNAFDVVAERKQVDFEKIAANVYEVEYEVVLRNHKTSPISVEVNEPIGGTWRILRSSHEGVKTEAWAP